MLSLKKKKKSMAPSSPPKKNPQPLPSQPNHTLPFQVFHASVSKTQKWSTSSARHFQRSFSASNGNTLWHCKWGQRDVACLSRCNMTCHRTVLIYTDAVSQTQLKHDRDLFCLWGTIEKDILPEVCSATPAGLYCRSSRRILEAGPAFHGNSNLHVACIIGKPFKLTLHWFCGVYLPYIESLWGQTS